MVKRLNGKRGPIIVREWKHTVGCHDDWGTEYYTVEYCVRLLLDRHGFSWLIEAGDFTCHEKKLIDCAVFALQVMEQCSPRYKRLMDHLVKTRLIERL